MSTQTEIDRTMPRHGQNQNCRTDQSTTCRTGKRLSRGFKSRFPLAMPDDPAQERTADGSGDRRPAGLLRGGRQQLAQALRGRRHRRAENQAGQRAQALLDAGKDWPRVKAAVAANRQRSSLAKAELEAELGKTFSTRTLERYIKNMVLAINESGNVPKGAVPGSLRVKGGMPRRVRAALKAEAH